MSHLGGVLTLGRILSINCCHMIRFLLALLLVQPLLAAATPSILLGSNPSPDESLAAREVRRYVYLRTGQLLTIQTNGNGAAGSMIVIARKDQPEIVRLPTDTGTQGKIAALKAQEYLLKTIKPGTLLIAGGDDVAVLYGAYAFAEKLGVRFYLHGDVAPDDRIILSIPELNETSKPLFALRGILPFHDFPEGPDWWNTDDYLACISQLAKLRMNFIGFHCYPIWMGPEPLVWIGQKSDWDAEGRVHFSYPALWANTEEDHRWGYAPTKTSAYAGGASLLFPSDSYGNEVQAGLMPMPQNVHGCDELFNRTAAMLRRAFTEAKALGIKTCVGTETPMLLSDPEKDHLRKEGVNPDDPDVVRELYKGTFTRIERACPVDYYWLWTPENWTWQGNNTKQYDDTVRDIQSALEADNAIGNPFVLATCGWVLGPQNDRATLDRLLPKSSPMSCINRNLGHDPIEAAFGEIHGRPKWAIPWLENDNRLTQPEPWVGRMRYDAADARRLGCDGLFGIHWRTKAMMQNISALAAAGWDQSWVPANFPDASKPVGKDRTMPDTDFYADFGRANFGEIIGRAAGAIMASVDGLNMPAITTWLDGPGGIFINATPWEQERRKFDFVDKFAALRPQIKTAGNLERFDYWLNTYRVAEFMARVACDRGELDRAVARIKTATNEPDKKKLANVALGIRITLARNWAELLSLQTAATDTTGELGTIANLEAHSRRYKHLLDGDDAELTNALGAPLPADATPSTVYSGPARIIVPTVRTQVAPGESLTLKVVVLDNQLPKSATLHWRTLGRGDFKTIDLTHVGRAVFTVNLPSMGDDLEYYISATTAAGKDLVWPATAPAQNQTVIVSPIN